MSLNLFRTPRLIKTKRPNLSEPVPKHGYTNSPKSVRLARHLLTPGLTMDRTYGGRHGGMEYGGAGVVRVVVGSQGG